MDAMKESRARKRQEGDRGDQRGRRRSTRLSIRSADARRHDEGRRRRRRRRSPPSGLSAEVGERRNAARRPQPGAAAAGSPAGAGAPSREAPAARQKRGGMTHEDIEATKAPLMEHSDRAAAAADPRALRVLRRVSRLLLFLALDLQHPDLALCACRRRRQGHADRHAFPRAVLHQHPPQHVRGGRHRFSGHRDAALQVRRARALQERAAGVPALSDRDADLLPARRAARLFRA